MSITPAADLTLHEATFDDAEALAALMTEMDDDQPHQLSRIDSNAMREVLVNMRGYPNFRTYILRDKNQAIGSFSLMIFSSPAHYGTPQAMLDAVVVTRTRRGMGLGEVMIQHALDIAADAGCYKMTLSSNLKRVDAHRFYERIGFRQHGISFSMPLHAAQAC